MKVFAKFRLFNRRLAFSCLLIAISTCNYGFDNQGFASTQAMDAFDRQFGVWDEKTRAYTLPPVWLSLFNSLNYIGFSSGVILGSMISSRIGRRWCIFLMSCYACVTATIAVTSSTREQIMAARVLNYLYVGIELAVIPTFQSEIVPAGARGLMVGSYQFSLILGGLIINCVCVGTSSLPDNRAWRIPLGLFYIVPVIILSLIFLVPESPRWLLRQDRVEDALVNLRKLREGAFTEEQILNEFDELCFSLGNEPEQGRFIELFQGSNLKRTLIVAAVNFFMQATGQAFVSQYSAIYVKSLGTINPFVFQLILAAVNITTLATVLLLSDHVGRRTLLFVSSAIVVATMMAIGGLGTGNELSLARRNGIVAMEALWACGFSSGWGPMPYIITTEVAAPRLRDLTSRVGFAVNVLTNFAVSFSVPYLLSDKYAGLHSRLGFIFGSIIAAASAFAYFFVPECTGKTLEQVDALFKTNTRLRDFGRVDAQALMNAEIGNMREKGYQDGQSSHVDHVTFGKVDACLASATKET